MSKLSGTIYVVINQANGKKYVGQTTATDVRRYFENHLSFARGGWSKPLYDAIREFGEDKFTFEVVLTTSNRSFLDAAEDHFIRELNTLSPNGYNMQGGGKRGYEVSEEFRQKMRDAQREVMSRPGMRERLRQKAIEQFSAPGAREAASERTKQQFADPDKRARHRAAYDNPETKAKMREQNLGKRWITNGTESRFLWLDEELPAGWRYGVVYGKPTGAINRRWINNGVDCRMVSKDEPIPDGWVVGKLDLKTNTRNAGMCWATDGKRNKMLSSNSPLPAGWRYGMTRASREMSVSEG